jgi:hypothetical protein
VYIYKLQASADNWTTTYTLASNSGATAKTLADIVDILAGEFPERGVLALTSGSATGLPATDWYETSNWLKYKLVIQNSVALGMTPAESAVYAISRDHNYVFDQFRDFHTPGNKVVYRETLTDEPVTHAIVSAGGLPYPQPIWAFSSPFEGRDEYHNSPSWVVFLPVNPVSL